MSWMFSETFSIRLLGMQIFHIQPHVNEPLQLFTLRFLVSFSLPTLAEFLILTCGALFRARLKRTMSGFLELLFCIALSFPVLCLCISAALLSWNSDL